MTSSANLYGTRRSWTYRQPVIALVTDGHFGYRTEREELSGLPGLLIVGNAGEAFEAHHCAPAGNQRHLVFYDQTTLEDIARWDGRDSASFSVSSIPPGKPSALASAWIKTLCAHRADEALPYLLASRLLGTGRPQQSRSPPARYRLAALRDAVLYINAHFEEPCGLETLAAHSGMSRYHFLRGFQRLTGVTPRQYVLHVRLVAAAERLIVTTEPIAQIALDVGFNDLSHFYRQFRERFGRSPARWREAR